MQRAEEVTGDAPGAQAELRRWPSVAVVQQNGGGTAAQGLYAAMAWWSMDAEVRRRLRDGVEMLGDCGAK